MNELPIPVELIFLKKLTEGGVTLVNMSIDCLHIFNKTYIGFPE